MKAIKFYVAMANCWANKCPKLNGKIGMVYVAQSESGIWWIKVQRIDGRAVWSAWEKLDETYFTFTDEMYWNGEIIKLKKPGLWIGGYPDQPMSNRLIARDETGRKAVRLPA